MHSDVVPMEIRRALNPGVDGCRVYSPAFSRRWEDWEESAARNALSNNAWRGASIRRRKAVAAEAGGDVALGRAENGRECPRHRCFP